MNDQDLCIGSLYWVEYEQERWKLVSLVSYKDNMALLRNVNESTGDVLNESEEYDIRCHKLYRSNPLFSTCPDMTSLHYLHAPGILKNIEDRSRLENQRPYTFISNILIAVNPLKYLQEPRKSDYRNKPLDQCAPHPYHNAECAYRQLSAVRPVMENQSIVISGESGAGKTETSKIILDYLTACVEVPSRRWSSTSNDGEWTSRNPEYTAKPELQSSTLGDRLMETIPLLEAFGNAKTLRNHNSSRFGKYMRLQFSTSSHELIGASIDTYLLEKSRLVNQPKGERNFHVFYQLLAGASEKQRTDFSLLSPKSYHYLNQSNCTEDDALDDAKDFQSLCNAFKFIGVHEGTQNEIFSIISGLLHLGNVNFVDKETHEGHIAYMEQESRNSLQKASELLGVMAFELQLAICEKRIMTKSNKGSIIYVKRDAKHAAYARDTIAKTIYEHLFLSIMRFIAISLDYVPQDLPYIGVLDIFGFENFSGRNSLEQLLINYANEALQSTFNKTIFIAEQELYLSENIRATLTPYPDNTECLELLSSRHGGIFSTLDNVSRMPDPSDKKLNERLHTLFKRHVYFPTPHPKDRMDTFRINHFAGVVGYNIDSFIEKNQNLISDQFQEVIRSSESSILNRFESDYKSNFVRNGGSLSKIFTQQMKGLQAELEGTRCNFIRCIKPNSAMKVGEFDRSYVLKQLQCSGTVQACDVLKVGLPTRILYAEIIDVYKEIIPKEAFGFFTNERAFTEAILWAYQIPRDTYQLGTTRLFFRTGKIALLDKLLNDTTTLDKGSWVVERLHTFRIHKQWVGAVTKVVCQNTWMALFKYVKEKKACIQIQCVWRRVLAQRYLQQLRCSKRAKGHWLSFRYRTSVQVAFANRPESKLHLLEALTQLDIVPSSQIWLLRWLQPLQKMLRMQRKWRKVFIKLLADNAFRELFFQVKKRHAAVMLQGTIRTFQAAKRLRVRQQSYLAKKRWKRAYFKVSFQKYMIQWYKRIHYQHLELDHASLQHNYVQLEATVSNLHIEVRKKCMKINTLQAMLEDRNLKIQEQNQVVQKLEQQLQKTKDHLEEVNHGLHDSLLTKVFKMLVCHAD